MALTDGERQSMNWSRQAAGFALRMLEADPAQSRPATEELLTLLQECPHEQAVDILTNLVNLPSRLALRTDTVPKLKLLLRFGMDPRNEPSIEQCVRDVREG